MQPFSGLLPHGPAGIFSPAALGNATGAGPFIDTFCRPDLSPLDFKNQLGAFTPCFIDIALLTPSYMVASALLLYRLVYLSRDSHEPKYAMRGMARGLKVTGIVTSFLCLACPLMTLNGRLASAMMPLGGDTNGALAPYEWLEYGFALMAWLLFALCHMRELNFYIKKNTWVVRFPHILVLAANCAKLHFVLKLNDQGTYFFYLYITFCALQLYLALLSVFFYPGKASLVASEPDDGYQPLGDGPPEAEANEPVDLPATENICPEYKANWLSRLTFYWISPLMKLGYAVPLEDADIWDVPPGDRVKTLEPKFHRHWAAEEAGRRPASLFRALWQTFGFLFQVAIPMKLINDVAQFGGPFFLNKLLLMAETDQPASLGYTYAALMLLTTVVGSLADNQQFQLVMRAGFQLRAVMVSEVYRKSLFLSPTGRNSVSSGKIINLITTDVEQLKMVCQNILGLISAPIRIIICLVMLYQQLGVASLAGLAVLVVSTPINSVLMRLSSKLFRSSLVRTDDRTKLVNDLIGSIEVVKCMAWEPMLLKRLREVRSKELAALWDAFKLQTWISVLLNTIPTLVSVVAFAVYVLLGNELTPANAFTSLTLFNQLRMPLFQLPNTITQLTLASVGLKRLQDYLLLEEQEAAPEEAAAPGQEAIKLKGSFTWDSSDNQTTLQDVDLSVPAGSLVAVVGGTGCGKSSLLQAMMGLVDQVKGPAPAVRGSVAYVPQTAFIFGASVRENILFGNDFDQTRYNEAVDAACLMTDLEALPGGDETELGDKGVNVSGGQKQRISIARAVYSHSDVVLMDDPLSALDAKVGRRVFNRGIKGWLKGSTVVLATNQLQFVEDADVVIFMKDGKVAEKATYSELMAVHDGAFAALMSEAKVEQEEEEESQHSIPDGELVAPEVKPQQKTKESAAAIHSLTAAEGRSTGSLSMDTIMGYGKALGGRVTHLVMGTSFFGQEVLRVMASLWLTVWTSSTGGEGGAKHSAYFFLGIYTAISLLQIVFMTVFTAVFKRASLMASRVLHDTMLGRLLRSPLSFFHTNPTGRIINRCTKDVSGVDKNVADSTNMFARSILTLLSTCLLMGSASPMLLPFIVVVMVIFYFIYLYFQASVRETKRLESISYSPLYTSLTDAINGLASIRAYRQEGRLIQRNQDIIDSTTRFALAQQSFNRWLAVRQESLGALIAFIAAVISIEERESGSAALLGLIISYALSISQSVGMTVRLASMAEVAFNSVDRVLEYCELEGEAADHIEGSVPSEEWPSEGKVEYQGVKMRYRAGLPLVLNGLDISFGAGMKCGVVGRTGAGKSSLINTLFRLMEVDDGIIRVDGVDISKVGLHQLRGAMSIIPQVPALFTGSLRFNLDPFEQYTDDDIWQAIDRAHLHAVVSRNPAGLDMQLREGGSPFSMGQKQLVALARALLKSSKVLVLDEATASVDVETDALIQKTIREEFQGCTLIAIAHRLHTIIESDIVVVMDAGYAVELGKPSELLSNPDGVFSSMVAETGETTERFLRAVAFGETDIMMQELQTKAAHAMEEIQHVSDPEEAVKSLASMAELAKSRITKVLATVAECDEAESHLEDLDSQLPASTRALLGQTAQVWSAISALKDILEVVSQLEAHLHHGTAVAAQAPTEAITGSGGHVVVQDQGTATVSHQQARDAPSWTRTTSSRLEQFKESPFDQR